MSGGKVNAKVNVLWISRHPALASQLDALKSKLGEVNVIRYAFEVKDVNEIERIIKENNVSYVVPVLPFSLIVQLFELSKRLNFTILLPKMKMILQTNDIEIAKKIVNENPERRNVTTYSDNVARVFEFEKFEVLKNVRIETEVF